MNNDKSPPLQPAPSSSPVIQVLISCLQNGQVQVSGFPHNMFHALDVLRAAEQAVLSHFHELAKAGKLDENLAFIQPAVITPEKTLFDSQGNVLKQ